ncbi:hypothetical protein [Virgibacillus chiguensis]|uniref:Uncharacterized protein n=1 Tax=Virgibacillus chiguensis TaxID=411959 RepID=A0A1M5W999_9BACI|nr:hypothetical protein [Virgibacillus chiguensis]SHH84102.1 hypothetical protein SAMN05421807_11563 [Virgibacillus chiguensis]
MIKKSAIVGIFTAFVFIFTSSVAFADTPIPQKEKTNDVELNQLRVSLTPKTQRIQGASRANWTLIAAHNDGRLPISYTLRPGDGTRYTATSFSNRYSFNHRYDPSGSSRTFNVTGNAIYDWGMGSDNATVYWRR